MFGKNGTCYTPLGHEEDKNETVRNSSSDSFDDKAPFYQEVSTTHISTLWKVFPWLVHLILLLSSTTMFLAALSMRHGLSQNCVRKLSSPSPALHLISDEYETWRFNGSFDLPSPYKGPPSPAVDAAWGKIVDMGAMSISEEDFQKLNSSKHAVKLPKENGGGRMALFEFVHQIHCVRMFFQHTYPEYYKEQYNYSLTNPNDWHLHMDHCADLLRQKLMCDADVGVITYSWIKGHYIPHPNFNVQHKCRNFDTVLNWAIEHQAPAPEGGRVLRPAEYVEFEEPPFDPEADG